MINSSNHITMKNTPAASCKMTKLLFHREYSYSWYQVNLLFQF